MRPCQSLDQLLFEAPCLLGLSSSRDQLQQPSGFSSFLLGISPLPSPWLSYSSPLAFCLFMLSSPDLLCVEASSLHNSHSLFSCHCQGL
ncbi:hypothetical protein GOP47_0009258 [Adiantum capillus-veneris]|uniref:Uncharacterized protein n=1 Tax=Adiantum capillus-veneris TaxID=13818 RepID=A0A9D4UWR4_ADICA|nr:hypothetical protein GOP47_0009258 [Adiantum capillus-veneris]